MNVGGIGKVNIYALYKGRVVYIFGVYVEKINIFLYTVDFSFGYIYTFSVKRITDLLFLSS